MWYEVGWRVALLASHATNVAKKHSSNTLLAEVSDPTTTPKGIFEVEEMSDDIPSFRGGSTIEGAREVDESGETVGTMVDVSRGTRAQKF